MNKSDHYVSSLRKPPLYGNACPMTQGHGHADFEVNIMSLAEGDFIVIRDLDQGNKSVTNDIKYVIEQLHHHADLNQAIDHYTILYQDSMNRYDGINTKDGRFLSFYPIQKKELNKAIKKALEKSRQGIKRL